MPQFLDLDLLNKRLHASIAEARALPDARKPLVYSRGERAALISVSSVAVGAVTKKTAALFDLQKGHIDALLTRVEKNAAQMSALHARVAALERKSAKG